MVLSMRKSTDLSMGLIINGIAANPIPVTVHFRILGGKAVVFLKTKLDSLHSLLMVNPGIATDANPCHINVSPTACTILRRTSGLD